MGQRKQHCPNLRDNRGTLFRQSISLETRFGNRCITVIWAKVFSLLRCELFEVLSWSLHISVRPTPRSPAMSAGDKSESMTATVSDLLHTGGPVQQVWFVTGLILGHQRLLVVTQLKGVITPLGFHSCARTCVHLGRCGHTSHLGEGTAGKGANSSAQRCVPLFPRHWVEIEILT